MNTLARDLILQQLQTTEKLIWCVIIKNKAYIHVPTCTYRSTCILFLLFLYLIGDEVHQKRGSSAHLPTKHKLIKHQTIESEECITLQKTYTE